MLKVMQIVSSSRLHNLILLADMQDLGASNTNSLVRLQGPDKRDRHMRQPLGTQVPQLLPQRNPPLQPPRNRPGTPFMWRRNEAPQVFATPLRRRIGHSGAGEVEKRVEAHGQRPVHSALQLQHFFAEGGGSVGGGGVSVYSEGDGLGAEEQRALEWCCVVDQGEDVGCVVVAGGPFGVCVVGVCCSGYPWDRYFLVLVPRHYHQGKF